MIVATIVAMIVVIAMTAAVHLLLVVTVAVRVLPRVAAVHLLLVVSVAARRPLLLLPLLRLHARALAAMTAVAPQQSQSLARALAAVDAVAPLPAAAPKVICERVLCGVVCVCVLLVVVVVVIVITNIIDECYFQTE